MSISGTKAGHLPGAAGIVGMAMWTGRGAGVVLKAEHTVATYLTVRLTHNTSLMCGKGIFLVEKVRQKAVDTASGRLVAVIEMSFTGATYMTKNVGRY